jgi:hypothetical protein
MASARASDPPPVEAIATLDRLGVHRLEVTADTLERSSSLAKPGELGMLGVPNRLASQDGLSEQAFAPDSGQPTRIKVLGV